MVAFAIAWEGRTGYYQAERAKKGILGEEISKNKDTDMGKHQVSLDSKDTTVPRARCIIRR